MKYCNLSKELIICIPELRTIYEQELELWDGEDPGAHNIFGDVLNPFLIQELRKNIKGELLERIFEFLEKMATSNDVLVKEVLGCTVLERIGDDKAILKKAEKYMKKETKKISEEIENGWRK
ncbi:DUF7674 family protein [Clostridium intestinale]|uniref:DUF7674 domain-containing protein n=1 Tax=Clostridium intestinale URNW TaxID=1294142 RepID=U2NJ12_9CLOT|nr:hypothetical protein [Clostridium intestinale]ERK29123.1 hypothetical protein CINTURNW_3705 [Clostridium intestinale URNW]